MSGAVRLDALAAPRALSSSPGGTTSRALVDGERFAARVEELRASAASGAVERRRETGSLDAPTALRAGRGPDGVTALGQALLTRVAQGERVVERAVRRGVRGEAMNPEELLVLQAQVYRAAQDLELMSKLVEKATAAVKTVLQQQG